MRTIGFGLALVCFLLAGVGSAQGERISLRDGVLVFAKGKAIRKVPKNALKAPVKTKNVDSDEPPDGPVVDDEPLGLYPNFGAVSANGKLAGVFNPNVKTITVYDQAGKKVRTIKPKTLYSEIAISGQGMIVVWGPWVSHPMAIPHSQNVAVYSPVGKLIKGIGGVQMGNVFVRFAHQGHYAAVAFPSTRMLIAHTSGWSWGKSLMPKNPDGAMTFVVGGVAADQKGHRLVFTTLGIGWIDEPVDSYITACKIDPKRHGNPGLHEWKLPGARLTGGSIALSPDGRYLFAIEPRLVRCFDLKTNERKWTDFVGNPDTGTTKPQQIAGVHASDHRVVTAHLVPTGKGWRVLYSVYTIDGKPVNEYKSKVAPARGINSLLSDEIPRERQAGPFWTISKDGKTLVTLGNIKIPLIEEKK